MNLIRLPLLGMCLISLVATLAGCQNNASSVHAQPRTSAYGANDQHEDAAVAFTRIIDLNPNDADAYFRRGLAYSFKGQYDLAIGDFTKTIELEPRNPSAYENRATMYYRKGLYDQALTDYTKAIEIAPDYSVAYANRAMAYFALKDFDKARQDVDMCRKTGGTPDPTLVERLAKANGRAE
jgi:tetratricopeptide (TPR) repeat protein